jgi:putative transcriptional regulator
MIKQSKPIVKAKSKRNLFAELVEGFEALDAQRLGKITLHTIRLEMPDKPDIKAQDVLNIRESLNLSRTVFAHTLHINPRTLENWEQGRAKPNAQAAVLLSLVGKYPDTVDRLRAL